MDSKLQNPIRLPGKGVSNQPANSFEPRTGAQAKRDPRVDVTHLIKEEKRREFLLREHSADKEVEDEAC